MANDRSKPAPTRRERYLLRPAKVLGFLAAALLVVLLLAIALFQSRSARERLLDALWPRLTSLAPGTLQVVSAEWPEPTRLEFLGILWTSSGESARADTTASAQTMLSADTMTSAETMASAQTMASVDTLASADSLVIDFDDGALLRQDLLLRELVLVRARLDIPAIQRALKALPEAGQGQTSQDNGPGDGSSASTAGGGSGVPWLRDGSVGGLPSIAVQDLRLDAPRVILSRDRTIEDLSVLGRFDLRASRPVRIDLNDLRFEMPEDSLGIEHGEIAFDAEAQHTLQTRIQGRFGPDWPFSLNARLDRGDSVRVRLFKTGSAPPPAGDGIALTGRILRRTGRIHGFRGQAEIQVPSWDELSRIPALRGSMDGLPGFSGFGLSAKGFYSTDPERRGQLALDLHPDKWVRRATARVALSPGRLSADSVFVDLADLHLKGAWERENGSQSGRLTLSMDGAEWLRPLYPEASLPESLRAEAALHISGRGKDLKADFLLDARGMLNGVMVENLTIGASGTLDPEDPVRFTANVQTPQVTLSGQGMISYDREVRVQLAPWKLSIPDSGAGGGSLPTRSSGSRTTDGETTRDLVQGAANDTSWIPHVPALPSKAYTGTVHYSAATGTLRVKHVRVESPDGVVNLDGHYAHGAGRFQAKVHWPDLPQALLSYTSADSAARALAASRWSPPYELSAELVINPPSQEATMEGSVSFRLPGPFVLGALFLEGADFSGLETVQGSVHAARNDTAGEWIVRADLSETPWIDTLFAAGAVGSGAAVRLDSLHLDLLGFQASGRGTMGRREWDASLTANLRSSGMVSRFIPQLGDSVQLGLQLDASVQGPRSAPTITAEYEGDFTGAGWRLPRFQGRAKYTHPTLTQGVLRLPQGAAGMGIGFDSLSVEYVPAKFDSPQAREARVAIFGNQLSLHASARVDTSGGLAVHSDSLRIGFAGRHLDARVPLIISWPRDGAGMRIDSLDLEGDLGSIKGHLDRGAAGADILLEADLDIPSRPVWVALPSGLWPSRLQLQLRSSPADTLRLELEAGGLQVGPDTDIALRLHALHHHQSLSLDLEATHGDQRILALRGVLPARVSLIPPAFSSRWDSLEAQLVLDEFPLPSAVGNPLWIPGYLHRGAQERAPRLTVRSHLSGKLRSPRVLAAGRLSFSEYDELSDYQVELLAKARPGRPDQETGRPAGRAGGSEPSDAQPPSIRQQPLFSSDSLRSELSSLSEDQAMAVSIKGTSGRREILTGRLRGAVPPWTGASAGQDGGEGSIDLKLDSRKMEIQDLTPLFPTVEKLGGKVELHLQAQGPASRPDLDGTLDLHEMMVQLEGGSRAVGSGQVRLSGTMDNPALSGKITIQNGRIRIPEAQRDLHPLGGNSLLWDQFETKQVSPRGQGREMQAGRDSLAGSETDQSTGAGAEPEIPDSLRFGTGTSSPNSAQAVKAGGSSQIELDTEIEIPSGLWLEGRGLEVELAGNLQITRSADPDLGLALTGALKAKGGSMNFHGSSLQVEGGTVTFYGSSQLNPILDIKLYKEQGDVRVTVHITGAVDRPRLTLSSRPEMNQSDILAFLIFGKRSEGLDQAESRRLEDRALATAEQFAASRLAQQVGRELGLDVVEYEAASEDSLGRSLTVGKYLSPNLLLKYQQNLENTTGIGLVVQYYLGYGFHLQMQTRREKQDGFLLNWEYDFR